MSRDHGFHPLRVRHVVQETHDTKSFVFDVPPNCTGTVRVRGGTVLRISGSRSATMSCCAATRCRARPTWTDEFTLTVKRVAGGRVSNWLLDEVTDGDELDLTLPAGVFTFRDHPTPDRRVRRW